MKKYLFAAAALAASVSAAQAACSKAALNGNWLVGPAGIGIPTTVVNGGPFNAYTLLSPATTVKINSFGSNCKGIITAKLTSGPTTLTLYGTIASETVASGSATKPNYLTIKISFVPNLVVNMVRQ